MKGLFTRLFQGAQLLLFYLLNSHKYKKLELKALVGKPRSIEGAGYISIHKSVIIRRDAWLLALKVDGTEPELTFGEGCSIGYANHISAVRSVVLGKNVLTANGVYISDNLHSFEDINVPIMRQPVKFKAAVSIGDGTWLGENVCVVGARIGRNCVVGANSVVLHDIPDYSVAVGSPARVIKQFDAKTNKWAAVARGA